MKKDSSEKGDVPTSDASRSKPLEPEREQITEISSEELDNIFFPDAPKESPHQRKSEPQTPFLAPVTNAPPLRKSMISIEDATPIPIEKEPPHKTHIPAASEPLSRPAPVPQRAPVKTAPSSPRAAMPPHTPKPNAPVPKPPLSSSRDARPIFDAKTGDITKVFVPADHIDDKGNIIPLKKADEMTGAESQKQAHKKPEMLYTIMLAFGRRIHFVKTIELCSEYLQIPPDAVERRIRFGKGILFEHVNLDDARMLQNRFLNISQGIRIVKEDPKTALPEPKDVHTWLFSKRHFQIITEGEKMILAWENVRMMSVGSIRLQRAGETHKKVLDICLNEPLLRLRLWDTTFNYKASGIPYDSFGETNFLNLIKILARFVKNPHVSPPLKEMLEMNLAEPRRFESEEEFDNYSRWLYLSFFGEPLR